MLKDEREKKIKEIAKGYNLSELLIIKGYLKKEKTEHSIIKDFKTLQN